MAEYTEISKIPKDFDDEKSVGVFNPLEEDFHCLFGGKDRVLKAGEKTILPEHVAYHLAKHLADKILRDDMVGYLKEKFPGLDDNGREKWRINEQQTVTKNELMELRNKLVFPVEEMATKEVVKPETKLGTVAKTLKAKKQAKRVKKTEDKE
jgi:hypothetical protein